MSFFSFLNRLKRNRSVNSNLITRATRATVEQLEVRQLLTTTVEFTGFAPPAINEGESATFTMIRYESSEDYSNPLTVNLTFQGRTIGAEDAATGADVEAPTTVTFAAGQQETSFSVTAIDDQHPEGNEWFQMSIASGGYDVGSDSRMTAIIESDVPIVWLTTAATGDDAPKEGDNQPLRFVAHRDNTEGALQIWFYAGSFDLVEGQDYTLPGTVDPSNSRQTLTFADGQSTLNIDVTVIDDQAPESTQSLTLGLYGASPDLLAGAGKYRTLGSDPQQPDFAQGDIRDNDTRYVWVTADQDGSEDNRTPATFTFHRSGDWDSAPSNKAYFTLSGPATPGEADSNGDPSPTGADYSGATASQDYPGYYEIEFSSGDTATLTLTPFNDADVEGSEDIFLSLCTVQDGNGNNLYAAAPDQPAAANAKIRDLVAKKIYDANEPAETQLDAWYAQLNDDNFSIRDAADQSLRTAIANYPEVTDHLGWLYQTNETTDENREQRMRLYNMLGLMRFHMEDNRIELSPITDSKPPGVVRWIADSVDLPNAGNVVVDGSSSLPIKPTESVARATITIRIRGVDENNIEITSTEQTFAFTIVEQE